MENIQLAALGVVLQVMKEGRNLNQVLDEAQSQSWMPAQRAALQDLSYGTLRYYGQLCALLELLLKKPLEEERVRCLLLVALYQLQYSKAAQYAVVNHAVRAVRTVNARFGGLVNAILRNFLRNQAALLVQAAHSKSGRYSYQAWWMDMLQAQYGEASLAILDAGNLHPPMSLRVNHRRITTEDYLAQLNLQGIPARIIAPAALQLEKPVAVNKLPGFSEGLVSVQDAGAQYAAQLLAIQEGMRVLDACAAPGGKTAHILECTQVELVAVDKDALRLERIAQNLQRLNLTAQLIHGDAADPQAWWDGLPFQRILADVPCSASGVVRRHPDIKWLRRKKDIASFAAQQLDILRALWPLLARQGKLLYVTCSVFQQENQQVIARFLELQADAQRLDIAIPEQLFPDDQHDGFFYALLEKKQF